MEGNWNARIAPSLTNIGVVVVCCAVLWFVLPLGYEQHGEEGCAPLFDLMVRGLDGNGAVVNAVNFGLICLVSFLVLRMVEVFSLFKTRTIVPTAFCGAMLSVVMCREEVIAGAGMTLLTMGIMFSAYRLAESGEQIHALNVGMLLVVGELFCTYFVLLVIPVISYLLFCDSFSLRTFLALMIGIVVAGLYAGALLWWIDMPNAGELFDFGFGFKGLRNLSEWAIHEKVFYGVMGGLLVFSLLRLGTVFDVESLKRRSVYTLCANEFFLSCLLMLFTDQGQEMMLVNVISLGGVFIGGYFTVYSEKTRMCKVIGVGVCVLTVVFVCIETVLRLV